MNLYLIVIGKLKDKALIDFESDYLKRLSLFKLKIIELKNAQTKEEESLSIEKAINQITKNPYLILLDEKGQEMTTVKFHSYLENLIQIHSMKDFIFVIGGATGHSQSLKNKANALFSLSKLTLPHRLARVLFVEQIYRVESLKLDHPYHKN